jgi:hypothetical protein
MPAQTAHRAATSPAISHDLFMLITRNGQVEMAAGTARAAVMMISGGYPLSNRRTGGEGFLLFYKWVLNLLDEADIRSGGQGRNLNP